jgi:hypothetical protein
MVRRLLSRPFIALLSVVLALAPVAAYAARPGEGQPFGIDWTPIVFWAIVGAVILGGFVLGVLIDWGNR